MNPTTNTDFTSDMAHNQTQTQMDTDTRTLPDLTRYTNPDERRYHARQKRVKTEANGHQSEAHVDSTATDSRTSTTRDENTIDTEDDSSDDLKVVINESWYAVGLSQGPRSYMQDDYICLPSLTDKYVNDHSMFAICDGHGINGDKASDLVTKLIPHFFLSSPAHQQSPEQALRDSYQLVDQYIVNHIEHGGCTAVTVYINKSQHRLYVANVGDSRAILYTCMDDIVHALTTDHSTTNKSEQQRVEQAGGEIVYQQNGWRVQGRLNMTRALGDKDLKEFGVIGVPDISSELISHPHDVCIIASDGIWSRIQREEAIDIISPYLDRLEVAIHALYSEARKRGSSDNISIIIILVGKYLLDGNYLNEHSLVEPVQSATVRQTIIQESASANPALPSLSLSPQSTIRTLQQQIKYLQCHLH